jgi:hypothetical protein
MLCENRLKRETRSLCRGYERFSSELLCSEDNAEPAHRGNIHNNDDVALRFSTNQPLEK